MASASASSRKNPPDAVELTIAGTDILALRTATLGNWSYVLSSDGEAVVIDPQRDVDVYLKEAKRRSVRIRLAIETHVHSDYVSGARALAHLAAADVAAPARGRYEFQHRGVAQGDELSIGGFTLTSVETPGHTFDHVAWLFSSGPRRETRAVFSGGSLLAGGAGRTDLFGAADTRPLTRHQFASLQCLAALPHDATVLPTHGGGSTCSAGAVTAGRFTTIGDELDANDFLRALSVDELDAHLAPSRGPAPAYFTDVAHLNRLGIAGPRRPAAPLSLAPHDFADFIAERVAVVDARDRWSFADGHIPGSINIEPHDTFANYVGSVVPFGRPIAIVVDSRDKAIVADLVEATFRIGYSVAAVLEAGIEAWQAAGLPLESYHVADIIELIKEAEDGSAPAILDVRDPAEWRDGALPGSTTIALRQLVSRVADLRALSAANSGRPVAVACRGGARAAVAASLLAQLGIPVRPVLGGGIPDALAVLAQ